MNTKNASGEPEIELIFTGFDAFAEHEANPSQLVVERLPQELELSSKESAVITKQILNTCSRKSWEVLEPMLQERMASGKTVVLIMLGLAADRSSITMERVGLNLRDYPIADNSGNHPPVEKIEPEQENALFSNIPLHEVRRRLAKKGFPVAVSNHAGTYVCNDLFFRTLSFQKNNPNLLTTLFVHVPGLVNYLLATELGPADDEAKLNCYAEIVKALATEVVDVLRTGAGAGEGSRLEALV